MNSTAQFTAHDPEATRRHSVLISIVEQPDGGPMKRRYWIR